MEIRCKEDKYGLNGWSNAAFHSLLLPTFLSFPFFSSWAIRILKKKSLRPTNPGLHHISLPVELQERWVIVQFDFAVRRHPLKFLQLTLNTENKTQLLQSVVVFTSLLLLLFLHLRLAQLVLHVTQLLCVLLYTVPTLKLTVRHIMPNGVTWGTKAPQAVGRWTCMGEGVGSNLARPPTKLFENNKWELSKKVGSGQDRL